MIKRKNGLQQLFRIILSDPALAPRDRLIAAWIESRTFLLKFNNSTILLRKQTFRRDLAKNAPLCGSNMSWKSPEKESDQPRARETPWEKNSCANGTDIPPERQESGDPFSGCEEPTIHHRSFRKASWLSSENVKQKWNGAIVRRKKCLPRAHEDCEGKSCWGSGSRRFYS